MARGLAVFCAAVVLSLGTSRETQAQQCRELRVAFQPDCYRPAGSAVCDNRKSGERLDLGPQFAVWVTSRDGKTFIDTVAVTQATGLLGIGNRPGRGDFRSSPRFPYGKRVMSLPIWAHARGRLYDTLVMQDGNESAMGFHESVSSPDPYFCRPMMYNEVDVDAVTCPTPVGGFNSSKGRFAPELPKTFYPPRNDLERFVPRDCDKQPPSFSADCQGVTGLEACCKKLHGPTATSSADKFATINDLDAVAAATPDYGRVYQKAWRIPSTLPAGEYTLHVEVNKEWDFNASHLYESHEDKMLPGQGLPKNLGQPSTVWAIPIRLDGTAVEAGGAEIAGYGSPDGKDGTVRPRDTTISSSPGSGEGRLLLIPSPWNYGASMARVHARTDLCSADGDGGVSPPPGPDGGAGDAGGGCVQPAIAEIVVVKIGGEDAEFSFVYPANPDGTQVSGYAVKYSPGPQITPSARAGYVPIGAPGDTAFFRIERLAPQTLHTVEVVAQGACGDSAPRAVTFTTTDKTFKQLEGCFVATAAYGSRLAPSVATLRGVRDAARERSGMARAGVDLYYRASPPAASVLSDSSAARALTRSLLGPVAGAIEAATAVLGSTSSR